MPFRSPSCPDCPARSRMSPLNFFYLTLQDPECRPVCKNSCGIPGDIKGSVRDRKILNTDFRGLCRTLEQYRVNRVRLPSHPTPSRSSRPIPLNFFYLTLQDPECRPVCKNSCGIPRDTKGSVRDRKILNTDLRGLCRTLRSSCPECPVSPECPR